MRRNLELILANKVLLIVVEPKVHIRQSFSISVFFLSVFFYPLLMAENQKAEEMELNLVPVSGMDYKEATIYGLVEGVTEFLPISSTGHLVLVSGNDAFSGPKQGNESGNQCIFDCNPSWGDPSSCPYLQA